MVSKQRFASTRKAPLFGASLFFAIAAPTLCAQLPDYNGDGSVDDDDGLGIIAAVANDMKGHFGVLDVDGNGVVDLNDLNSLRGTGDTFDSLRPQFGSGDNPGAVPQATYLTGNALVSALNALAQGHSVAAAHTAAQGYIDLAEWAIGPEGFAAYVARSPGEAAIQVLQDPVVEQATGSPTNSEFVAQAYADTEELRDLYPNPTDGHAIPNMAWVPIPNNFRPMADPRFKNGTFSGPYGLSAVLVDGVYSLGDGTGGFWWSTDTYHWERGTVYRNGVEASAQNSPIRHIEYSAGTGTYIATMLGGGGRTEIGDALGTVRGQFANVARSKDGKQWDIITLPETCGLHYSATNGNGTWIAPGCGTNLLVSFDDGLTWEVRSTGLPASTHLRVRGMGYHAGKFLITVGSTYSGGGIYSSNDLTNWTQRWAFPPNASGYGSMQGKRFIPLDTGEIALVGTQVSVVTSTDAINWQIRHKWDDDTHKLNQLAQAGTWHPSYGYMFGGEGNQLIYSKNGMDWVRDTRYSGFSEVQEIIVSPSCEVTLVGMQHGALGISKLAQVHCDVATATCAPVIIRSCDALPN